MEFRKYDSLTRFEKVKTDPQLIGRKVYVFEKLDGANGSFELVNDEIKAYSRNREVTLSESNQGFYGYVHQTIDKSLLEEDLIYYGEWLVKHKVNYHEDKLKKFYLFDVYNRNLKRFLSYDEVVEKAKTLGLETAPLFKIIDGFKGFNDVDNILGKSLLCPDIHGEGLVVKCYETQAMAKIIDPKFAELSGQKERNYKLSECKLKDFLDTFLTEQRVYKVLMKKYADNQEALSLSNMGNLIKETHGDVLDDIVKEELDTLIELLKKYMGKTYPSKLRETVQKIESGE